jgi:hypothetical protein
MRRKQWANIAEPLFRVDLPRPVLGWSPDRHLAAGGKVGLNFALDCRLGVRLKGAPPAVALKPDFQSARQPLGRRRLSSDNPLL